MTKLLVVGAGSIGTRHAQNARTLGVTEIAVVDPDRGRRDQLASTVGAHQFDTLDAALEWGPQAAVICSPPASHVAAARAAAAAGCHLLIEKPLAATRDGIDALEAMIAQRSLRAGVAYQLRFHPAVRRMHALVQSGNIGRLLSIQAEYGQYLPNWRPSRDYRDTYTAQSALGGGIMLDGSHEIDYVRWIAGEISAVFASAAKISALDMDVEDTAALVLAFPTRTIGEIHLDCVQRGYSRRCVLIGSEATVRWDATTGLSIVDASGTVHHEPLVPQPNDPYLAEMKAFLDGDAGHATIADGARVVAVIDAARQSAATRREIAV